MKPILFSPLMVTAIRAGLKTQTRRLINRYKIQLERDWATDRPSAFSVWDKKSGAQIVDKDECAITLEGVMPILQGDILYIREHYYAFGLWVKLAETTKSGKPKWKFIDKTIQRGGQQHFVADGKPDSVAIHTIRDGEERWYKRNSLFMPKEVAREFLQVTKVRVERANDISEEDAKAEGVIPDYPVGPNTTHRMQFKSLWWEINGEGTWDKWVFVYDFKKIEKPIPVLTPDDFGAHSKAYASPPCQHFAEGSRFKSNRKPC